MNQENDYLVYANELKEQYNQMKAEYEERIRVLEERIRCMQIEESSIKPFDFDDDILDDFMPYTSTDLLYHFTTN